MRKKVALVVFGLNDVTCDSRSRHYSNDALNLFGKVQELIKGDKLNADVLVLANHAIGTNKKFDLGTLFEPTKVIKVSLFGSSLNAKENFITLNTIDGDTHDIAGCNIDMILKPEDYVVYVAGIDIGGMIPYSAKELKQKGYNVSVITDRIKFYNKHSEEMLSKWRIKTIGASNVGYYPRKQGK